MLSSALLLRWSPSEIVTLQADNILCTWGKTLYSFLCLSTLGKWVSITEHESVEIGYWSHGNPNNDSPLSILSQIYRLARDPYLSWAGDRSILCWWWSLCFWNAKPADLQASIFVTKEGNKVCIYLSIGCIDCNPNQSRIIKSRANVSFHGNWVPWLLA